MDLSLLELYRQQRIPTEMERMMKAERTGKDRVWMAYTNEGQILKVLFEGFELGRDFTAHPKYEEFSKFVQELAEKVFDL